MANPEEWKELAEIAKEIRGIFTRAGRRAEAFKAMRAEAALRVGNIDKGMGILRELSETSPGIKAAFAAAERVPSAIPQAMTLEEARAIVAGLPPVTGPARQWSQRELEAIRITSEAETAAMGPIERTARAGGPTPQIPAGTMFTPTGEPLTVAELGRRAKETNAPEAWLAWHEALAADLRVRLANPSVEMFPAEKALMEAALRRAETNIARERDLVRRHAEWSPSPAEAATGAAPVRWTMTYDVHSFVFGTGIPFKIEVEARTLEEAIAKVKAHNSLAENIAGKMSAPPAPAVVAPRAAAPAFVRKPNQSFFTSYDEAYAEAQARANELGMDIGLEKFSEYGKPGFRIFMLPAPGNRYGFELRAQVVPPTR